VTEQAADAGDATGPESEAPLGPDDYADRPRAVERVGHLLDVCKCSCYRHRHKVGGCLSEWPMSGALGPAIGSCACTGFELADWYPPDDPRFADDAFIDRRF
jgi:hypothetical protein